MFSRHAHASLPFRSLVRLSSSVPAPTASLSTPARPPPSELLSPPPSVSAAVSDGLLPLNNISPPIAIAQAPNMPTTWSQSQTSRHLAYSNARFEQTILEYQPQPVSAMAMIAAEPVLLVKGRKAVCDGGGGALGHPKIYINLDQPGPRSCGYCGNRFEQDLDHHHHAH